MSAFDYDVVVVGSGPAGIATATSLNQAGVGNVVVFEREAEIGGIPRHTLHPTYGLLVFKRPMSGPKFLRAIVRRCPTVKFETQTTVVALRPGGELELVTPMGSRIVRARHVVIATGAREAPRHPRLVSGLRPQGVLTTGALQQFVHQAKILPFRKPVIVGTELVSLSALWTLRSAGARPAAIIEANARVTAYRPAAAFARIMGTPIHYDAHIVDIGDVDTVSYVAIAGRGGEQRIECDGVIFSGQFVGENTLVHASHLASCPATGLPVVDQHWLCSDPMLSAVGNTVHPADMGDQCYFEGLRAGRIVAEKLVSSAAHSGSRIAVTHDPRIKMTTPNSVCLDPAGLTRFHMSLHVLEPFFGIISVKFDKKTVYRRIHRCLPARRIRLRNIVLKHPDGGANCDLQVTLGA